MTNEVIFTPSVRLRYFPLWVGIGSRTGKVDTGSYFASRCGSQYAEDNPLLFWPIHCAQLLIRVQKPTFEATLTRSSPLRSPSLTKCGRSPALPALFSPAGEVRLEVMEFDFRAAGSYHYRYTWGDDELLSGE